MVHRSLDGSRRRRRLALAAVAAALLVATLTGCTASTREPQPAETTVRAVVPEVPEGHLQFLSFWLAQGGGYFADEGLDVQVQMDKAAPEVLLRDRADVAVLPPPMYVNQIANREPVLLFANLLRHDPINLVVRPEVAKARGLSADAPLAERLQGLRGLEIGVAPGPPNRLRTLFASVGMDADVDVEMVIVEGNEQNEAFGSGRVDALYAHTPYLETALVEQGGVLLVNQSAGEVPQLASRQMHTMATTRRVAEEKPEVIAAMTRAIGRAQQLARTDQNAATEALLRSDMPGLERPLVKRLVSIYAAAVPPDPAVTAEGVRQAAEQFRPETRTPPDLTGIDLNDYILPPSAEP